jgi:hypothetical protein
VEASGNLEKATHVSESMFGAFALARQLEVLLFGSTGAQGICRQSWGGVHQFALRRRLTSQQMPKANCKNWNGSAGDRAWSIMKMAPVVVVPPSWIIMR